MFCCKMMKSVLKKYGWGMALLSVFAVLFLLLQFTSAYHFFYIEQNQVFLYSSDFAYNVIVDVGGLSAYVAVFLLQFFIMPYVGALICAALFSLIIVAAAFVVRRQLPAYHSFILYISPTVALLFVQMDVYYFLQGTVAYLFCLWTLDLYVSIKKFSYRLLIGILSVPVLFYAAGPVSGLFAVSAVIYDALVRKQSFAKVLALIVFLLFGVLFPLFSVYLMQVGSCRMAFLPDFYYNSSIKPMWNIYLSWIVFPVGLLFIPLLKGIKRIPAIGLWCGVQTMIVVATAAWCVSSFFYLGHNRLKAMNYYAYTGDWDKIIQESRGKKSDARQLNYLNLALSKKGVLADYMFLFDQKGKEGLIKKFEFNDDYFVLSDCYFNIGAIAKSQHLALSSNVAVGVKYNNPRMLQRMVQCCLILGEYPAAEKLLQLLDKSLFYREWSAKYRRFLYDDEAVAADAELGEKRKVLAIKGDKSFLADIKSHLVEALEVDSSNKKYISYLGCTYLLEKDMAGFKAFIENYFGVQALTVLPRSFEEAVMIYSESDPDYWTKYGISPATIERHKQYKQMFLSNRNSSNLKSIMYRNFGETYWYYMMFKNWEKE